MLIVAPLIFTKGASLSLLSQMGTVMIFGLSFNMLLGQGGMLSFGHAVYSGLGAFCAIHAMNLASAGSLPIPVTLIPLAGGFCRPGFRHLVRLCDHAQVRYHLCHDHAGLGRAGVRLVADAA